MLRHLNFWGYNLTQSSILNHILTSFVPNYRNQQVCYIEFLNLCLLSVMIKLYYAFIYPYFVYGILVWGNSCNIHLNPLVLLQKKIIRIVTASSYLSHTKPLFYSTKILRVEDIFRLYLGIYMFKKKLDTHHCLSFTFVPYSP